jgi:diketogulonate reductase-like aldo/keto reductase
MAVKFQACYGRQQNRGTGMDPKAGIPLHTGNKMPVLGLGTWQLTDDTAGAIAAALGLGYRLIDTAADYGTQPGIGEGIGRSGVKRSDVYLVTKVEETDDAYEAARKNLSELQLEYADLMLIHRPPRTGAGEDLWRGLIRAKEDGLTRDIGISNYSAGLIDALIDATGEVPTVNQIEWSPFGYSDDMLRYASEKNIVIQAYSPLTRTKRLDDETLAQVAAKYGKSPAQVLIRWNLQRGIVPIPKANQRGHLEGNIDVFDFHISEGDMATLNGLNERYSSLGMLPYV